MADIYRFIVRSDDQDWNDKGPDLFRKFDNAVAVAKRTLPSWGAGRYACRVDDGKWQHITKAEVDDKLKHTDNQLIVGYRKLNKDYVPTGVVRKIPIDVNPIVNASPGCALVYALAKKRYPVVQFGGAYVWKLSYPGYYSDHAWGDAVDCTSNPEHGLYNGELTDWIARMAQSGNLEFDYLLGAQNGRVVKCERATGYAIQASNADRSHLWHTHVSVRTHNGARPYHYGGY